ncbi:MAG: translation factor Sua5, partial [Flavobacterium sp.]|nr:translation factor Sua5 [Flavobacterium sp.]
MFNTALLDALKALQNKQIILYPTDTVWGLGCDATCAEAVAKIFELKN